MGELLDSIGPSFGSPRRTLLVIAAITNGRVRIRPPSNHPTTGKRLLSPRDVLALRLWPSNSLSVQEVPNDARKDVASCMKRATVVLFAAVGDGHLRP
ncbi:hypothetical protein [Arthrobacter globiformis]|uniref:hypothetical protein n=1 Tax=Arthrobacter globiformis TaxID=1665 RepID=UPI0011B94B2E|nr:hypothetical protein [Arthrobacter globiformis]